MERGQDIGGFEKIERDSKNLYLEKWSACMYILYLVARKCVCYPDPPDSA